MSVTTIEDQAEAEVPDLANEWLSRVLVYGGLIIACAFALRPTAIEIIAKWAMSSTYMHGFAVAPLAVMMIRAKGQFPLTNGSLLPGISITICAAAVWLLGQASSVALISQLGFVGVLIGFAGVIFGSDALRAWAFPLGFLFFMVPFGETLIPALQFTTAEIVVTLLTVFGGDVSLDGYLITTPVATFEVARACSGLNFLIASMMIAAIFSYLHFKSWRKHAIFLIVAAITALLANGLRAFFIVAFTMVTNDRWEIADDHLFIGWLFYALVVFGLLFVGSKFSDTDFQGPQPIFMNGNTVPSGLTNHTVIALGIIAFASIYNWTVIERPIDRTAPTSLTLMNVPGWRILPPPENWRASLPNADRTLAATYATEEATVYLSVGYYTHERRDVEIVQSDNLSWNDGYWRKTGMTRDVVYLFGQSSYANITLLSGPERRHLAVVKAYWLDGELYVDPWRIKFAQMKARILGRNASGGLLMIAAAYHVDPADALQSIRNFTVDVEPLETWLERNRDL